LACDHSFVIDIFYIEESGPERDENVRVLDIFCDIFYHEESGPEKDENVRVLDICSCGAANATQYTNSAVSFCMLLHGLQFIFSLCNLE
jgi:hypothetical protein